MKTLITTVLIILCNIAIAQTATVKKTKKGYERYDENGKLSYVIKYGRKGDVELYEVDANGNPKDKIILNKAPNGDYYESRRKANGNEKPKASSKRLPATLENNPNVGVIPE